MKKKLFQILSTVAAVLTVSACNLDINKDPYAVTTLDFAQVLTATEYEVGMTFAGGNFLNSNFSSYVHHTVSREVDNYSLVASYSTLGNTWSQAYRYSIKNCDALISGGDEQGNAIYAGIARILRAHIYMNLVDLWGDIPYSEANIAGIETPKRDKSEVIYNDLLKSINTAIANLKDTEAKNTLKPGANDLLYAGNVEKWIKAGNTLKLKLLVQSRLAKSKIENWQSELSALLAEGNFLLDGEDLQFPHTTAKTPLDERNASYIDEYEGGQKTVFISPWLHECMAGVSYNWKNNPFKGIKDPRIPYYFYNQSTASSDAANATDYRDGAFISIMFGSNSGYTSMTQEGTMTTLGVYPCGGQFDDGSHKKVGANLGNGVAPDKMLQAYSVPFMLAELYLAGEASGDARAELEKGIKASLKHVVVTSQASDSSVPAISADAESNFINAVLGKYDAASNEGKIEIVMTQKWIANFFNPVEAYSDIRRTGYPILFTGDENNMAWTPYAQTVEAAQSLTSFNLVSLLKYPRVMYYPQGETQLNPNITNEGRVVSDKNVFWDVK